MALKLFTDLPHGTTTPSELKSTTSPKPILDGLLRRDELARQLGKNERTLARWHAKGIGPPCLRIGKTVFYNAEAVRKWLITTNTH